MSDLQFSQTEEWYQARRSAFVQDILAALTRRPADLLPFEEVRQRLGLRNVHYLGLQDVPLDLIIGSVGRPQDFTRAFFPRKNELRDRWRQIGRLAAGISGLPPVELYKVGQAYFVRDGNHRVSVARQNNAPSIEAYVWEYETRVPLGPDTDIDDLLSQAARAAFLERTGIDRLCPDVTIELSEAEGYEELLYEIETYQQVLSQIDERQVPFDEAVTLWCEMRYTPVVEIIRQRDVLRDFPERTEADLYLWLGHNQEELEVRYGQQVRIKEAADDLVERFSERPTPARQLRRAVGEVAQRVGRLGDRLAESITTAEPAPEQDVAAALLAPIRRAAETTPPYRFPGTTQAGWEAWRAELRRLLWNLLGVRDRPGSSAPGSDCPWQPYRPAELQAHVAERVSIDGLWRELVWLNVEPDLRVPAYAFSPSGSSGARPAVVIFPGHGTIDQAAGLARSPQQANALELARAGLVTLAVEPRGFGRLGAIDHLQIDAAARLVGRTWQGLLVQDGMRAIDYLHTRPDVDPARIAATGLGEGGAAAMYTAALDERVRVALVYGYLGKYVTAALDAGHCPCSDIPGILRYAEMGDVAALIAPRAAMFVNGRRDPRSSPAAQESFATVRHVYRFLGVQRHARFLEPEELGYAFDNQLAVGWLRRLFF